MSKVCLVVFNWYLPHYTPSAGRQALTTKQVSSTAATDSNLTSICFYARNNCWESMDLWIGVSRGNECSFFDFFLRLQQRKRQNLQEPEKVTFYRRPVTSARCIIGVDRNLDIFLSINYLVDDYPDGYQQLKKAFNWLTKDVFLEFFVSDHEFGYSKHDNDVGVNLYVYALRY